MAASIDEKACVAIGLSPNHHGAVAFATTHWSVVREAQGESAAAKEALEKLCRAYWRPLFAFVQRQGYGPEEAQDLTQGFFALLLERRDLNTVRKEKGRLRSYLLASLKHFLANERQRALAMKRGGDQRLIPLDESYHNECVALEPLTAEKMYEHRWALTVLDHVLERLRDEYSKSGNSRLFGFLNKVLTEEPQPISQAEIAKELSMTESAVKQAFYRLRLRYRQLLREEIAQTVVVPGDIEDELRHLVVVLRA